MGTGKIHAEGQVNKFVVSMIFSFVEVLHYFAVESTKKKKKYCDNVDVDKLWQLYRMEIIGRGFYGMILNKHLSISGINGFPNLGTKDNPWKVEIDYETLSPWMSEASRKSRYLPNTEFKKKSIVEHKLSNGKNLKNVSQEDILNALHQTSKAV